MATNKLSAKFFGYAPTGNHFDGEGLYLLVRPDGKRYWHMACYLNGKRKLLSFGPYPKVSLEKARKARKDAQELLDEGIDPVQHKKDKKQARIKAQEKAAQEAGNTFKQIAKRLYQSKENKTTEEYRNKMLRQLEIHVFPVIGNRPITEIEGSELLRLFRNVATKTNHDRPMTYMAKKLCQWTGEVFDYAAVENNDFSKNPCRNVIKHLPNHETQHMPRISFADLPKFLEALKDYKGHPLTKAAIWHRQPEKHDKTTHALPLPTQAIALLKEIKSFTGDKPEDLVFPSITNPYHRMSEAAICQAIKRMGFTMVGHGLRSVVSTGLNELGFAPHMVELQIGHKTKSAVEAAYNDAKLFDERQKMIQTWSDFLNTLLT